MGRELRYLAHGAMMRWPAVMQVDEFGFHSSANWGNMRVPQPDHNT